MKRKSLLLIPLFAVLPVLAQPGGPPGAPPASLKTVPVPSPAGLDRYVADPAALVALGKVFFWDAQAGSDGRTACATCHFHAGADHRLRNQITGASAAPNRVPSLQEFPFRDVRQLLGSAGVVERQFVDIIPGSFEERSTDIARASAFSLNGVKVRQVTTRNSPSVINSVFNARNFWDGRARAVFSGSTPFGESDTAANVWVNRDDGLAAEPIRMENASLASQAVGPALNEVEMSHAGRTWPMLGRKLLSLPPLARQRVALDDSVLGPLANPDGLGLRAEAGYDALIRQAFLPVYWNGPAGPGGESQMELNFPLFWGLALQAYQSTLVANDSRVDQFLEGRADALDALEQQGLQVFRGGASQCSRCHAGPELTAASFTAARRPGLNPADPGDAGFFRIGVSPISEDIGLGGRDGFGVPLFLAARAGAADGAFKAPGLRNVELTGPYFHTGGYATLEQVVDFYSRNGDFPGDGNLGPGIGQIRLGQQNRRALVAFLKALTDERVRYQRAPFDHPSLCVPDGHEESAPGVLAIDSAQSGLVARDRWSLVSAVGREGLAVPLRTYEELLRGIGADGSRANTQTTGCEAW